jgi:hypothetical protein
MELHLTNPDSACPFLALGVSTERRQEIMNGIAEIITRQINRFYNPVENTVISSAHGFPYVAGLCESLEEHTAAMQTYLFTLRDAQSNTKEASKEFVMRGLLKGVYLYPKISLTVKPDRDTRNGDEMGYDLSIKGIEASDEEFEALKERLEKGVEVG